MAGAAGAGGGGDEGDQFPCDVLAVMQGSCQRCHQDPTLFDAPFPLMTWQDTQVEYLGRPIYETMQLVVEIDFMPLMGTSIMPPVEPLTPDEKATLLGWLEDGAPGSSEMCD